MGAGGGYREWAEWSAISSDGTQVAYDWFDDHTSRFRFFVADLTEGGLAEPRFLSTDCHTVARVVPGRRIESKLRWPLQRASDWTKLSP